MYAEEKFWHKKFAKRRVHGEWFLLKPYEELLMLLAIMNKGYESMIEYEYEQAIDSEDARRRVRNLKRRLSRRAKKLDEARRAGLLPSKPRTRSRGKEYADPQRFDKLRADMGSLLEEIDSLPHNLG
jgi:hypothetical protein